MKQGTKITKYPRMSSYINPLDSFLLSCFFFFLSSLRAFSAPILANSLFNASIAGEPEINKLIRLYHEKK